MLQREDYDGRQERVCGFETTLVHTLKSLASRLKNNLSESFRGKIS